VLSEPRVVAVDDLLAASAPLRLRVSRAEANIVLAHRDAVSPRPLSRQAAVRVYLVTARWTERRTSEEAPAYWQEGLALRGVPLRIATPLAPSRAVALDARRHLRSRLASAYFADEWTNAGSLLSAAGLASEAWCLGGQLDAQSEIPLGVLARAGETTL